MINTPTESLCISLLGKGFVYPFIIIFYFFQVIQFLRAVTFVSLSLALYIFYQKPQLFRCFFLNIHTFMYILLTTFCTHFKQNETLKSKGNIALFLSQEKWHPIKYFHLVLQPAFFIEQDMKCFSSQ